MRPGTRVERVRQLASAGMWAVGTATVVMSVVSPGVWTLVGSACTIALTALSFIARLEALPGGGRRKGGGVSGRGRDDDDGPAGEAAHRWHALVTVSRLMPASAGRRWLAEAESLLAEVTAARRGAALRSYLLSAPRLAVMMWAREVLRRAQPGPRRPG